MIAGAILVTAVAYGPASEVANFATDASKQIPSAEPLFQDPSVPDGEISERAVKCWKLAEMGRQTKILEIKSVKGDPQITVMWKAFNDLREKNQSECIEANNPIPRATHIFSNSRPYSQNATWQKIQIMLDPIFPDTTRSRTDLQGKPSDMSGNPNAPAEIQEATAETRRVAKKPKNG